ncbi:S49 family peptidase [Methylotenera sp.]|uniref:S49 family peptidase n=1 Tax=Methylotenera sp. TaxID=2051956 RepID=UPI002486D3CE|nr:S49 family peptidase [Methylotenera sp.]MDI1362520.1 S49 family peptidase [Methylotenera sp.]
MKKHKKELWVGSIDTFNTAQVALDKILASTEQQASSNSEGGQGSRMLSIVGGVGIINIAGSLVNNDSWMNQYLGVTSYNDIRTALAEAVGNPLIKHIVLDINSGGGAVSGITDTATLISQINQFVKPVTAYTGGVMASGAYWLGASAGRVVASDVAVVGSIGVITSHMDYSAAYAADGVVPTVIRAGKFKQLNSPLEPLSSTGLEEIQSQLDQVYSVFVQHVADNRSVSYSIADTQMAQGREFIGASALTAGLVDSVSTFDSLMSELVSKVALDSNKSFSNNNLNPFIKASNMTLSLNAQQLAVISAGGVLTPEEIAAATALATLEATAETVVATEVVQEEVVAEVTEEVAVVAEVATANADLVTYLQTQLKEVNASLLESTISLRDLQALSADALANQEALMVIAAGSVNKMNIALGSSERDLSALTAVQLLAEHSAASIDFNKKFKVGGVAVATSNPDTKAVEAKVSPMHKAKVSATKERK